MTTTTGRRTCKRVLETATRMWTCGKRADVTGECAEHRRASTRPRSLGACPDCEQETLKPLAGELPHIATCPARWAK